MKGDSTMRKKWSPNKKFNMACMGVALICAIGVYAIEFFK